MHWSALLSIGILVLVVGALGAVLAILIYQGKRTSVGAAQYVALGSSFAAGIGLGSRASESPIACMRTTNGYPQQLARMLRLSLVDNSCSGATTEHVIRGGQYFQRPQLDGLASGTELVTITTGGNDVRYVGDLSFMAARNSSTVFGWAVRTFWKGPLASEMRDFDKLEADLLFMLKEIRRRSPDARIVLVSYPTILPASGNCSRLNISLEQLSMMREVGSRLAEVTRHAATAGGAIFVNMNELGANHHACSGAPWVNGWNDAQGTQFHPTLLGAQATATAIAIALKDHK